MKIYTKTGDHGTTSLLGGVRISKGDHQIEAYGCVDELNASLGVVRAHNRDADLENKLIAIQEHLFHMGSELAQSEKYRSLKPAFSPIGTDHIKTLEDWIDEIEGGLEPLKNFILPGGALPAAFLHLSRCICRRAERQVVKISRKISPQIGIYLNRLSDLLFVMARLANLRAGVREEEWRPRAKNKRE